MESLVDVTTTSFEAILGVCIVFGAGYLYNVKQDVHLGKGLRGVSRTVLLPALAFTTFAASSDLTWRRLLQLWPTIIIALAVHLPSLFFGLLSTRIASAPAWLAESLTFNNVAAYPLLLVRILYHLSRSDTVLGHLRWRTMDTVPHVLDRANEYIVANLLVTEIVRTFVRAFLPRSQAAVLSSPEDAEDSNGLPSHGVQPDTDVDVEEGPTTERTPLVRRASSPETGRPVTKGLLPFEASPLLVAALLGLFIALVKPTQHALVGSDVRQGDFTGSWRSIGQGLSVLGLSFAIVDLLADGAGIRAGEKKSEEEKVPPTLGTTLVVVFWRFIAVPAIVLGMVVGFRKVPSTTAYLQDPVFSFVLVLVSIAPPALPPTLDAYRAAVHAAVFFTSLFSAVPLAIAFAIAGRGISRSVDFDLLAALKRAGGGGLAGALAMVLQVLTLMPLRTIMNYQYRYGGKVQESVRSLYADGGFTRYYAGLGAALFQGPLARFGDTAANAGILALLASVSWPVLIKTIAASLASAAFRMVLTPIDTLKTTQQTRGGKAGLTLLRQRIKENGVQCLWWGALATAAATFVGHYPWFGTYNWLSSTLPPPHNLFQKLARQAFIGFAASVASDTISNSLRVVKTYRQVHERDVGYFTAAKEIVASEGLLALFGRGLPVRLVTNGLQGLLFSILWKLFTDLIMGDKP